MADAVDDAGRWGELKTLLVCQELLTTILAACTDRHHVCPADPRRTFQRKVIAKLILQKSCPYSELAELAVDNDIDGEGDGDSTIPASEVSLPVRFRDADNLFFAGQIDC